MDSPCIKQTVCKVLKIFQCGKYLVAYVLKRGKCGKAERTDSEKDVSGGAWQRLFSQQRISKGAVRTLFEKQLDLSISREPLASCDFSGGPGPRGNTLIFSSYVGLGTASTVYPPPLQKQTTKQKKKKHQEYQALQKIFEIFATPNISKFCIFTLRKDPKIRRNNA